MNAKMTKNSPGEFESPLPGGLAYAVISLKIRRSNLNFLVIGRGAQENIEISVNGQVDNLAPVFPVVRRYIRAPPGQGNTEWRAHNQQLIPSWTYRVR